MLFLGIVIRIMEVNDSLLMSMHDLLREQNATAQILADLSCHIISLCGVDDRILVGVLLLDLLVDVLDQRENAIVRRVRLSRQLSLVAVAHILLCHLITTHLHNAGLDHVLNVFHIDRMGRFVNR